MSRIYQVMGEHNRYGEWIAGTYDNESAALEHKAYLDETKNGWENMDGGFIKTVEIMGEFNKPEKQL